MLLLVLLASLLRASKVAERRLVLEHQATLIPVEL